MFLKIKKFRILKRQTITEAAVIITIITFFCKIFGYAREMLVAKYFGTSAQTDAFLVAMLIPSMILGLFSRGIQTVVIREYAEKKTKSISDAKILVNQIFFIFSVVLVVVSLFLVLFSEFFIKIVAFGFTGERLVLASNFMKFLTPFGVMMALGGLFTGLFQIERQFLYPAFIDLISNMLIPLSLVLLSPLMGIGSWAVGQNLCGLLYFFPMFFVLKYRWKFFDIFELHKIRWNEISEFVRLMLPIIVVSGTGIIYQIIDKMIASFLPAGSISTLNFAQLVFLIPYGLLATSISVSVYPSFSTYAVKRDNGNYSSLFEKSLFSIAYIMIPISLLFVVFSHTIVQLLFERGAFGVSATNLTAGCVVMYSIGLFALSFNSIFYKAFFSFKDTKTPMYISLVTAGINIVLDILLARIWGASGIALATTIVTFTALLLYAISFKKKHYVSGISSRKIYGELLKIIFASAVIGVLSFLLKGFIPQRAVFLVVLFRFGIVVVFMGVVYLALTGLLGSSSFNLAKGYFQRFFGWFKKVKD
ncbi:MAG: murein biosynthesis integral membrane protein MurJ [Actinobacteria bacterium]|nr:murein biosynthesis integral membrane protein MurJ [Actinomycetota bacterium]